MRSYPVSHHERLNNQPNHHTSLWLALVFGLDIRGIQALSKVARKEFDVKYEGLKANFVCYLALQTLKVKRKK